MIIHKCGNCGQRFICLNGDCVGEDSTCWCLNCTKKPGSHRTHCRTRPIEGKPRKKGTFIGERVYQ